MQNCCCFWNGAFFRFFVVSFLLSWAWPLREYNGISPFNIQHFPLVLCFYKNGKAQTGIKLCYRCISNDAFISLISTAQSKGGGEDKWSSSRERINTSEHGFVRCLLWTWCYAVMNKSYFISGGVWWSAIVFSFNFSITFDKSFNQPRSSCKVPPFVKK